MSKADEFWIECASEALDMAGVTATDEQIKEIAATVQGAHENYGMAFYSPPSSDRVSSVEREWKAKYAALEKEFERYRNGAEKAVGRALGQPHDAPIGIKDDGSVYRFDGRITQIA